MTALISADLVKLSECQDLPIDLEPYVKKLIGSRRRILLVNSILQNAQVKPLTKEMIDTPLTPINCLVAQTL